LWRWGDGEAVVVRSVVEKRKQRGEEDELATAARGRRKRGDARVPGGG
jgi:hypothetical protein